MRIILLCLLSTGCASTPKLIKDYAPPEAVAEAKERLREVGGVR